MAPLKPHTVAFLLAVCFTSLVPRSTASQTMRTVKTLPETSQPENDAGQKVWCVAKPAAPDSLLNNNLMFACGEGGADCTQIQPGSACYNPNTAIAHASYAMNMYYHSHGRNWWNCYFNNTGLVVFTDPSFGSCFYPAQ